ncbi:glycosyltransferase [Aerococcus urinaeequi]|uniref:Glycosyltransferase n=1 Tax=Aerococcus urinaeequi TaxID=51665 RepID=A0A7M1KR04_9LACT|nr:glycosyltransferase [Aerococcus urinaeequi]QOQ78665.1 glycosyltransferase [Aerococcus urinaeequi]
MIKILHYGLTNHLGGIESYLYRLVSNIDRTKFKLDFLILGNDLPCFYQELKARGCEFHFVTERSKNPRKNKNEIREILLSSNYDIVHCNLNSLSYITPALEAINCGIPTIVHSRNAGIRNSIKSRILHKINFHRIAKDNITKLAVSRVAGEWMFGKNQNFTVINNGVDINKFKFDKDARAAIRDELSIEPDEYLVAHTGALRDQKNHKFILDIFEQFHNIRKKSKLLLVGSGELEGEITTKIKKLNLEKSVIMLGNRSDIPNILSGSDAYLFPSLYEGFPNSVIEAETSGLPTLMSDTITDEVIVNKNARQLSLSNTAKNWAETLVKLVDSTKERNSFAEIVENEGFSVNDEITKIENIYLKLTRWEGD